VPLGLGTDTAGSIRLPAAWCGLVGHKPTHGRVSLAGVVPLAPSFDHGGALVRTVDDARLALSILLGTELEAGPRSADLTGLRIGVVANGAPRADASVQAVLDGMLGRSVDAGVRLVDARAPEWTRMRDTFFALQASEALGYHRELGHWPDGAELYGEDVRGRLRRAESFTDADIAAGRDHLTRLHHEVNDMFAPVDVVLQLVAGSGPSETASPDEVRVDGAPADLRNHVLPHTLLASLCGLPACSIPVGADADGLPVGLQVIGARGQDELVLDVAEGLLALGP
jgi:aspartyl-tRNA(Asn)/glutamyl-tRNA(Gln) amidotransferase subunit A